MLALGFCIGYHYWLGLGRIESAEADVAQHTAVHDYDSTKAGKKEGEIQGMFCKKRWTEVFARWNLLGRQ